MKHINCDCCGKELFSDIIDLKMETPFEYLPDGFYTGKEKVKFLIEHPGYRVKGFKYDVCPDCALSIEAGINLFIQRRMKK